MSPSPKILLPRESQSGKPQPASCKPDLLIAQALVQATGRRIENPLGLPGFEENKRFVAVHFAENAPLIYLQSLEDPTLCFITMPILAVDPQYRLRMSGADLGCLGLHSNRQPRIGDDVLCLTVL